MLYAHGALVGLLQTYQAEFPARSSGTGKQQQIHVVVEGACVCVWSCCNVQLIKGRQTA